MSKGINIELPKMTLPKSVANQFGNVFVPNVMLRSPF